MEFYQEVDRLANAALSSGRQQGAAMNTGWTADQRSDLPSYDTQAPLQMPPLQILSPPPTPTPEADYGPIMQSSIPEPRVLAKPPLTGTYSETSRHVRQMDHEKTTLVGNQRSYFEKDEIPIFVCPPLAASRWMYGRCCPLVWLGPMLLGGFGMLLQNFQLRIGTYYYVHKMLQHDLHLTPFYNSNATQVPPAAFIPMTFGVSPQNVSYGSMQDTVTASLGDYQYVKLGFLDMLAAGFPMCFFALTIALDQPHIWTRIMVCFFVLAVGKGLFAWITVEPDSSGWQHCYDRLAASSYPVEWYAEKRSLSDIMFMNPFSRLCADMMWSGHTYFVTLFAFGLHECVRLSLRASAAWKRLLAEFAVGLFAFLQQSVEIYYVLVSRFHYTADVVMAVFVTYLLYTNSTIAVLTTRWLAHDDEDLALRARHDFDRVTASPKWIHTLTSRGVINLGCCCCDSCCGDSGQQYIYSREDIMTIMDVTSEATSGLLDSEQFAPCSRHEVPSQMRMTPEVMLDVTEAMGMLHPRSILGGDHGDGDIEHGGDARAHIRSSPREFEFRSSQ